MVLRPNQQYYDEFSAWYERDREDGYHALVDRLESELACEFGQGGRVLEAGCGTGLILRRVACVARAAYGLDLSRGMLTLAQEKGLTLTQGSITDLPFPDGAFDLVYSFKVLAHIQPIARAFAELARVVRKGGHLLLEVYNARSLRYLIKRLRPPFRISEKTRDDAVYTRYDTLESVASMLPPGIEIIGTRGVRVLTPVPQALRVPVLGPALASLESWAADAPALRELGGFLIVIARKR